MARILLIDDDEDVRDVLAGLLEGGGHEVIGPPPGVGPDQAVLSLSYDLLIADIVMPGVSGWELIKLVRQRRPGVPVIAISGGGMMVSSEAALKFSHAMGADATVAKPVRGADLLQTVAQVLQRRHRE